MLKGYCPLCSERTPNRPASNTQARVWLTESQPQTPRFPLLRKSNVNVVQYPFDLRIRVLLHLARTPAQTAASRTFKQTRESMAIGLYKEYNRKVFGDRLPSELNITWCNKLNKTAGRTFTKMWDLTLTYSLFAYLNNERITEYPTHVGKNKVEAETLRRGSFAGVILLLSPILENVIFGK